MYDLFEAKLFDIIGYGLMAIPAIVISSIILFWAIGIRS